ncbi:serine/threonine protein phosphatase [Aequorivita sublithincola DSM 14238]|uniref:Serine/threonine protein phosphatase n=1 Tax=Aequorivita sublithincola (strain DSM 14238 / LMG 21431 / ACAM 643 / 9-3) TaxID=746697 RepID=I3YRI2_AEQSU|nr:protein phosphatase 2C domain-containing protein [Aequorivita sublithincola]AFL79600.1 serine/threonine protein phosphatase [Aequorivita sublithincola DSM 14238]
MKFLFSKKNNKVTDSAKTGQSGIANFCEVYAVSETGPVRNHNEDSIGFSFLENDKKNLIAVVADGMGGHNAGEVASKMACDLLLDYCVENWKQYAPETLLHKAFMKAHQEIIETGNSNSEQKGMGTTATAVIIKQDVCYIGHIGDSRAYLLRNSNLKQLSRDHTLVNQMFESGEITEQERDQHPMKNVLLQALGTTPTIEPQISADGWAIQKGDRLFLCSDGVYDALSVEDIKDLLLMKQPEFVLECLSTTATSRNVSDNFSALLIDISTGMQSIPSVTKEQNII